MSAIEEVEEVVEAVRVPKMIDADRIASLLDISKRHLLRLVHDGEFPKLMLIGRASRWPASDVAVYLDKLRKERARKQRRGRDV